MLCPHCNSVMDRYPREVTVEVGGYPVTAETGPGEYHCPHCGFSFDDARLPQVTDGGSSSENVFHVPTRLSNMRRYE